MDKKSDKYGVKKARWNLGCFYKDINDSQIDADIQLVLVMMKNFYTDYKGQLSTKLGLALVDYDKINCLLNKLYCFLSLKHNLDISDTPVSAKSNNVSRVLQKATSEYLTFFDFEVVSMEEEIIDQLTVIDAVVAKYRPMINDMRLEKSHMLSEEVEIALNKRSSFGSETWSEFFGVMEANLKFDFCHRQLTLADMFYVLSNNHSADVRALALKLINDELGKIFAAYSAQTLNVIVGEKAVEDKERGYQSPMSVQNRSNGVSDAVVDNLHIATKMFASPLVKRYYRLKGLLMNIPTLRWSDRNASISCLKGKDKKISFNQAFNLVVSAYNDFSPTLAGLVVTMLKDGRIDAVAMPNKHTGAFNLSTVLPGNYPVSFTLMNYRGSGRDVMTLAHELGHSVHGLLSGAAQGTLMSHSPTALCETASTFGEMLVFDRFKSELVKSGDKKRLLKLLMERINDTINTIVRQIGFSNFERRLHGARRWLSVHEINSIWIETTKSLYGQEGEVFTYENINHLWSTIPHFHRPFYVYGYAFADLLTSSLYAQRAAIGSSFEPLYLDFLRAGGSKSTTDLLKPFGLNLENLDFWVKGIKISLEDLIIEAENLCCELGFDVPRSEPLLLPSSILMS